MAQDTLLKKADSERLWDLTAKLNDYATREQLQKLTEIVLLAAQKEEVVLVKDQLNDKFHYLKSIVDTHCTRDDALLWVDVLKSNVYRDLLAYQKKDDTVSFIQRYEREQLVYFVKFAEYEARFSTNEQEAVYQKSLIVTKAEDVDLKSLAESTKKYAIKAEFEQLQNSVLPQLEAFKIEMFRFKLEREQHTDILMRYDEILLDKASKFNIAELREDVYRTFAKLTHI
jgi:hypothetical protein